jgi:hypothetical protein
MTTGTTQRPPPGWVASAHQHWQRGQKHEAIQAVLDVINAGQPALPHQPAVQFSFYLSMLGDWPAAAEVLKKIVEAYPDDIEALKNLGTCLARTGQLAAAYEAQQKVLSVQPDNFGAWDSMAMVCSGLGLLEEARKAGEQSLALKDALSNNQHAPWALPSGSAADFATQTGKTPVISFSLWGNQSRYLRGALRNALLAPDLYPGWRCRFYVDDSVPAEFIAVLAQLGAEVIDGPVAAQQPSNRQRLVRRFLVANDPGVGYFMVRDCDSVVNLREALAVQAWLASGNWFHVMRDGWTHTDLMLAGMWGGVAGALPDLQTLADRYVSPTMETPHIDQFFLRDCVWQHVRQSCLVHDEHFKNFDAQPMPQLLGGESCRVGIDEYAVDRDKQARLLGAWMDRVVCLR